MLRKQKISSLVYGGLLIPIFLISFFLSGLFRYSGVTVLNFGSYLNQMFEDNFIFPWRYYNAKTPACLGMGMLVWIFLVSYLQFHYRNFQTGKEYGVEDWADPVEVTRRRSEKDPRKNRRRRPIIICLLWDLQEHIKRHRLSHKIFCKRRIIISS